MTEVKIQANQLLIGSENTPALMNEKSNNAAYSRESSSGWDDED